MIGSIYKTHFNPSAIALKYKGDSISYAQLDLSVNRFAAYLHDIGLKPGERVLLSSPNSPNFIYSYLGVVKAHGIIVPINRQLTLEEVKYIASDCGATYMIIDEHTFNKVDDTKENLESLLGIKIIVLDDAFNQAISSFSTDANSNNLQDDLYDEHTISTFLYTSGTTGKQKAAMLTHKNLGINAEQCRLAFKTVPSDHYLCVLPMHHVFAFTTCVLNPLLAGSTITILEKFHPKEVLHAFNNEGITVFAGVPVMYVVLLEACKNPVHFPHLRLAISGGAAIPVEILKQARTLLNLPVVEGYGLTESSPVVSFNPLDGVQKPGSIGLPIPYVQCKIVDENGLEVPTHEIGEIIAKGENIMLGYYNQEEETKKTIKDGWLYTGDLGKKDEDGYIYIVDRKKDLVIVGGVNVYPREIEEVLYQFPKVKEAAVIGVDDALRGEHVKAFVVLKENEVCTAKELSHFLKQSLAPYKIPKEIQFISELPKNSTGKIMKRMLKA